MGYRPDNQALSEPIEKIIEGFQEFESAVDARIECGEWKREHLERISELANQMRMMRLTLKILHSDTW